MAIEHRPSFDGPISPTAPKGRLRSLSDISPALVPSPDIRESPAVSKDDSSPIALQHLSTPRRHDWISKPLLLQMPEPLEALSVKTASIAPQPQQQHTASYTSHATSLPRHSRGLDFSRACTNLHHSTLAESSPDSSPIYYPRNGSVSYARDNNLPPGSSGSVWSSHSVVHAEPGLRGGSAASTLVHASPVDSESDDDDSMGDHDDSIYSTPQVHRLHNPSMNNSPHGSISAPAGTTMSPNAASLMRSFQRTRLRRESSNKGSIVNNSPFFSPKKSSPFALHSIETNAPHNGLFSWPNPDAAQLDAAPSVAPDQHAPAVATTSDSHDDSTHAADSAAVMRKVATQRKNLLPKTKGFARIKAALQEEGAPVDTEVRREAETIRQVREHSNDGFDIRRPSATSPQLLPTASTCADSTVDDTLEDNAMSLDPHSADSHKNPPRSSFGRHATKNSSGVDFWNRFDDSFRTPPPTNLARQSSDDTSMHNTASPTTAEGSTQQQQHIRRSESIWSTSTITEDRSAHPSAPPSSAILSPPSTTSITPSTMTEPQSAQTPWARKFNGKRSRSAYTDNCIDDLDIMSIKRRAVSPSLSVQNSPVAAASAAAAAAAAAAAMGNSATHSPRSRRESLGWSGSGKEGIPNLGLPGPMLGNGSSGSTGSSGASVASGILGAAPGKRVGLQGMTDTSDGFMKMSIE